MALTVFGAPLSPFVRKVRLCLLEKALEYELKSVMPFTPPQWYLELNPLGRIPAFKDGDFTLADSSVICQYLEEAYGESPRLYGNNVRERSQVRWLEKYADYELAPLTTFGIFRNRIVKPSSGQPCNEETVSSVLNDKLPPHIDYLEQQLGQHTYFVGDQLTMADIAITCQLVNMTHGGESLDANRWPGLAAHYQRTTALASFAEVLPGEQRMLVKLEEIARAAGA